MKLSYPKFDQILYLLQISTSMACMWPHDADVSKLVLFRKIYCSFSILNTTAVEMTFLCAIYKYRHDVSIVMKAISEFALVMEVLCNLILCRMKCSRIQHILTEMKNFFLVSNDQERIILQKYIHRYAFWSVFVIICYFMGATTFCCIPTFTSKKLPSDGLYPFPIESPIVLFIVYVTQVHVISQIALCLSLDLLFAVFFMYSAARLEMLNLEILTAKNESQFNSCIKKHQEIIRFVDKIRDVVQFGLFKSNFMMGIGAICGIFPIINRQSLKRSYEFIILVIAGCQRLSISAWPADDLKENSERVAMEVYNMSWVGRSCIYQNMCFMMQRSQRPLVISMGGLLPTLSLKYYAKYLMTLLSYVTTMRAVFSDSNRQN